MAQNGNGNTQEIWHSTRHNHNTDKQGLFEVKRTQKRKMKKTNEKQFEIQFQLKNGGEGIMVNSKARQKRNASERVVSQPIGNGEETKGKPSQDNRINIICIEKYKGHSNTNV